MTITAKVFARRAPDVPASGMTLSRVAH